MIQNFGHLIHYIKITLCHKINIITIIVNLPYTSASVGARGSAVVEALRYKPEGRGIDSRWCHWDFSLT
jgi:hypothetical protein